MKVREAVRWASKTLQAGGVENAQLEAEYLIAAAMNTPRLRLSLAGDKPLKAEASEQVRRWVRKRAQRIPLAYVLNEQPFLGNSFRVTPDVLIPRQETELLVERAQEFLSRWNKPVIVDVGTGSGNIAISLAKYSNVAQVYGIDVSEAALRVAQDNAHRHGVADKIQWLCGNLLQPVMEQKIIPDLIVANLPYVRQGDLPHLQPEVLREPRLALDGGPDGLDFIRQCVSQAEHLLLPGGILLMEIGADQENPVLEILRTSGLWTGIDCAKDLSGLPRIVQSERGN